ncbi:MAG: citryl-CoA lyase [Propylenella sp.]
MRIGKQDQAFTAIATSDADTITIRGRDLCRDLIGKVGFTDYFYFLVTGEMPTENQRFFTEACMVALAEHGLVPSVQAARMTLVAAPEAWQGAMAAGLLGMGTVVAGSSEVAGKLLVKLVAEAKESGKAPGEIAKAGLQRLVAAKEKVPGLGHPQHATGDPRANVLLKFADDRGVSAAHVEMLRLLAKHALAITGRQLPINVTGAIPAVMLDVGYPAAAMKGLPLLARAAGLVAHLYEESQRPIGFIMSNHADRAIAYDGPPSNPEE